MSHPLTLIAAAVLVLCACSRGGGDAEAPSVDEGAAEQGATAPAPGAPQEGSADEPAAAANPVTEAAGMSLPGTLLVTAVQEGQVYVDGSPRTTTGREGIIEVDPGRHVVQVYSEEHEHLGAPQTVLIRPSVRTAIHARNADAPPRPQPRVVEGSGVEPPPAEGSGPPAYAPTEGHGRIGLRSNPSGTILVDGYDIGVPTPAVLELPLGTYAFQVRYDDGRVSRHLPMQLMAERGRELILQGTEELVLR